LVTPGSYMYPYVYMHTCTHMPASIQIWQDSKHTYIHTYIHTYKHTYIPTLQNSRQTTRKSFS
jgi:hypothetical protein